MTSLSARHPVSSTKGATLADILERVLDKGVVITGDIRVKLVDIELLTIQIRLVVCSVDRAKEIGIDWWRHERSFASPRPELTDDDERFVAMEQRLAALESSNRG